ncbi:hypothetical protein [Microcoleus sp. B9-D4]|uniref:hypothetical protein n=1 Tax=Microcoleus sp. B9-D4 TaxID=2818711 RepID=UPI002FD00534
MLLVGGAAVSSGFCSGFSGWVVGGAAVSGRFGRGFSGWVVGGRRLVADLVISH